MLVQILLLCAIGLTTMGIVKCGRNMKNRSNTVVVRSSDGSGAPVIPRDDGDDGTVLSGSLPPAKMKLTQAWIEIHREDLQADWRLAVSGEPVFKIDPLK
jgi:hypothetical protein